MSNATSCVQSVDLSLADQIARRLSDIDELIREVRQRIADKQEIGRLCKVMEDIEKKFLSQDRVRDEWKHLQDALRPHQKQIGDLYEAAHGTVSQIRAFAASLHIPLTLCAVEFPQTENHRRALGRLGLVQRYGEYVSWDAGLEGLTAARHLLEQIYKVLRDGQIDVAPFPTPAGSGWEDIQIRFLSDHQVQITVKHVVEYRNYAEMGLEDGRSHKPNKSWECLRTMALEGSVRRPAQWKGSNWPAIEQQVQRLRNVLRSTFGITGDPFHRSREGYQPRFRVSYPNPDQH